MQLSAFANKALASLSFALLSIVPARAHAPVATTLPLHHVVAAIPYHRALTAKFLPVSAHSSTSLSTSLLLRQALSKQRGFSLSSNPIIVNGHALSGSNSALFNQLKTVATRSIYTTAINIGPLNSGTTYSTVFTGTGPVLTPQPAEIDEFGRGNALNNGGGTSINYNTSSGAYFNFGQVKTAVSGKIISTGAFSALPTGSGATRAYANLFSSVAQKGVQDGIYLQSHPIGGVLEGTYYYPSTFYPVYYQILAFGNSPLNNPALTSAVFNQYGSYLALAHHITVPINSGQFLSTYYLRSTGNTFVGQAYNYDVFGSNPLNLGGLGPTLGATYPFSQLNYLSSKF